MQRTFGIIIDANGAVRVLDKLDDGFKEVAKSSGQVDRSLDKTSKQSKITERSLASLTAKVAGFTTIAGAAVFAGLTVGAVNAGKEFQRLNRLLSDSDLAFVRAESDRLGLSLQVSANGFAKFSAAAAGTALEGAKARDIFRGLNTAVAGLGLSSEQANGALTAFEQIVSKGTVQAEELRGQLGERIPGAFQVAARAMNLTTQELNKQLELGQVLATDFLPKFAAELEKTYSGKALTGAKELTAEQNRFNNALFELQGQIADGGAIDAVTGQFRSLTDVLKSPEAINAAENLGAAIEFLIGNIGTLATIGGTLVLGRVLAPQFTALAAAINVATASAGRFGVGLVALNARAAATTAVMTGLRGALALVGGPVGLAVIGAAGLYQMAGASTQAEKALARLQSEAQGLSSGLDLAAASTTGLKIEMLEVAQLEEQEFLAGFAQKTAEAKEEIDKATAAIVSLKEQLRLEEGLLGESPLDSTNKAIETNVAIVEQAESNLKKYNIQIELSKTRQGDLAAQLNETLFGLESVSGATTEAEGSLKKYGNSVAKILKAESDRKTRIEEITSALSGELAGNKALRAELDKLTGVRAKQLSVSDKLIKKERERQKTIKDLNKLIEQGADVNGVLREEVDKLTGATEKAAKATRDKAKADREAEDAAKELARVTGTDLLRSQEELNRVLDQAELYTQNYAKALEEAKAVLTQRGLIEGTKEYEKALEDLGFRTEETTTEMSRLWQNTTDNLQDSLAGFFEEGLDGWDNFADSVKGIFKKLLAQLLAQWVASGISGLFNGQGFSGFSLNNAFGGGQGGGFSLGGLLGSETSQRAVGATFGDAAGRNFSAGVQGAGGALSVVGGFNQIDAGLEQGGSAGALSVVSGASSIYAGYGQLASAYSALVGASSGGAIVGGVSTGVAAAEGTAAALASLNTTIAATEATLATSSIAGSASSATSAAISGVNGTAASTSAGAGASSATAALGATAFWIAAGVALDQGLNDGRVTNAFAGEFEARKQNIDALFDGDFSSFFKGELSAGYDAVLATFAARPFEQILAEDYLPDLLGINEGSAAGRNAAVFGNNFGLQGSGLSAQFLADGGENGNGGFFTGAQSSLDEFERLLNAAGFDYVKQAGGVLKVFDEEQDIAAIQAIWEQYNAGLETSVAFNEVFKTSVENGLIQPSNLFFENFSLGFNQNFEEARASLVAIDGEFDKLVENGVEKNEALFTAISEHYGIAAEEAQFFVEKSGRSIDEWTRQFTEASGQNLQALIDFNDDGVTTFGRGLEVMQQSANDSFSLIEGGLYGLTDVALAEARRISGAYANAVPATIQAPRIVSNNPQPVQARQGTAGIEARVDALIQASTESNRLSVQERMRNAGR